MFSKISGEARHAAKRLLGKTSKVIWRDALERDRTIRLLAGREIERRQGDVVWLPAQDPLTGVRPQARDRRRLSFEPEYIWSIERDDRMRSLRITPSGTVLLNHRYLLDTDRGSWAGLRERPSRGRLEIDCAIAPWSHNWGSFGDYVFFVLAKLCRMKEALNDASWATATLCYPLRRTGYEQQFLSRLGFGEERILDTRDRARLSAQSLFVANNQSVWWLPSPNGVFALRRTFLTEGEQSTGGRRLYISRSRWRRKVRNETEVRQVVRAFGLEFLEDVPTSVDDQIRLFHESSLIVSAHGSGLANLIWCRPGTRVIELFSRSYTVMHFAYVSHLLHLNYAYLVDDSPKSNHWTNMGEDMSVDVHALERALEHSDDISGRPEPWRTPPS